MLIYVYAENTALNGEVYRGKEVEEMGTDLNLWGEGNEEELIKQATDRLLERKDKRPGGAGDGYDYKCARNVLKYLGVRR